MSLNKKERETRGIKAILIFEIIGRPPEHLKKALEEIIKRIDEEKGVEVREKKINEPVLMKEPEQNQDSSVKDIQQEKFYTTFAEIEIEVEEILYLAILMFRYMPAHIEIIEPELIALSNNGWNDIFNELTRRLHGYDEVARILQLQNAQMQQKLNSVTKSQVSSSENVERRELMPELSDEKKSKKKEDKAATIEAGKKIEKAKFKEEKHATKVKSPKQEKNDRKGYNKQSRGH